MPKSPVRFGCDASVRPPYQVGFVRRRNRAVVAECDAAHRRAARSHPGSSIGGSMNQRVRRLSHFWLAAGAMLFGIAQAAGAQTSGNIAGRVVEAGTNAPIASAQVQVVGTTRGAVT